MKLSNETNEIFGALAKMQMSLENAKKKSKADKYKYADLATCIEVAKPVLAENGLAVTQMMGGDSDENRTLITMLTHSSGQYISSEFVMAQATLFGGAANNPAQVLGSAITYMRRYAFAAIIGLAQEDEEKAQQPPIPQRKIQLTPQSPQWKHAKAYYKKNGHLNDVLNDVTLSDEHEIQLKEEVENEG